MSTFLGLLGIALYIIVIIALAAGITWAVVKLFPPKTAQPKQPAKP